MRFLLDQSAEARIATFLTDHGHDATRIAREYPPGRPGVLRPGAAAQADILAEPKGVRMSRDSSRRTSGYNRPVGCRIRDNRIRGSNGT